MDAAFPRQRSEPPRPRLRRHRFPPHLPSAHGERLPRLGVGRGLRLFPGPGDDRATQHRLHEAMRGLCLARESVMKYSTIAGALFLLATATALAEAPLEVGFGSADITPIIADKPVFIDGFGHNRRATGVADPLFARAAVLRHGQQTIALVAIDVVGFFHANVERVRKQLPGFEYVLVSSTHNHEGPDTLGLWGKSPFASGVDADYMKLLEERIANAV